MLNRLAGAAYPPYFIPYSAGLWRRTMADLRAYQDQAALLLNRAINQSIACSGFRVRPSLNTKVLTSPWWALLTGNLLAGKNFALCPCYESISRLFSIIQPLLHLLATPQMAVSSLLSQWKYRNRHCIDANAGKHGRSTVTTLEPACLLEPRADTSRLSCKVPIQLIRTYSCNDSESNRLVALAFLASFDRVNGVTALFGLD